jgi:hypothetical protein
MRITRSTRSIGSPSAANSSVSEFFPLEFRDRVAKSRPVAITLARLASRLVKKSPSDRVFMRPLDDNNAGGRPIARGIGRPAHDRGAGSEEIAGRCPFLGGCAPHGSGQRIRPAPAAANARQRE